MAGPWYYYAAMAAIQVFKGSQQGKTQDYAARAEDRNAEAAQATGYGNEARVRRANEYKLGVQRAAAAESGFDPNSGSFATMQGQSAGNAELDALTERYKGQLQANMYRSRASQYRYAGHQALVGGYLGAASTVAGGMARGAGGGGGSGASSLVSSNSDQFTYG